MARRERVLITGLGIGLSAVLLIGLRQAQTPVSAAGLQSASAPAETAPRVAPRGDALPQAPAAEIQEFVRLLGQLRANDESVLPALREVADRLCTSYGRCDGREILAFYAALAPEDRARGLAEEARCSEIVRRVRERYQSGPLDDEWVATRDEAIDELSEIAAISLSAPDVYPGACAASQRARLLAGQLLSDYSLDQARREELLDSAREDAQNSLAALERCGMLTGRLEPIWVLGHLYAVEGDSIEARRSFEECLALAERVGRLDWQEKAYQGLVDLAREAGDVHEVELLLDEISRLDKPEGWFIVREHATLLLQSDLPRSALDLLLANPPARSPDSREWNMLLGSAYLRQGLLNEAREHYAHATPLPFSRDAALGMASIDLRDGNAERVFVQLSGPEFRLDLDPSDEVLALQMRGEAALALGREMEAVEDLERALGLGDGLQSRLGRQRDLVGVATSVIGERVGLHALALLAEGRGRLGQHLEAARAIENWQSRTLRPESERDVSTDQLLDWARTTDLGLLTWVVGANSTVVAHVAPGGTAQSVRIGYGHKSVDAAIRRLNEAVLGASSPSAEKLSERVRSELLPQAILSRLGSGRLLVLVHGPIERLPIEFLFRDDPIVPIVLPGLPSADPGSPLPIAELTQWSILGSPVDSGGRPLLPGSREELARIARLRSSGSSSDGRGVQAAGSTNSLAGARVGTDFDRESLIAALRSTRALHLATHLQHACGRAQGRLADLGFELSRGEVLCAREIAEIRPRLPLAVLSACATAEGRFVNAEGLQGIARAFLESGTRNLVVTLWPVADESARVFAEALHENLIAGTRPSEAVATARATLRGARYPAADWAAFRLIGRD